MKTVDYLKNNNIDVDHGLELLGDLDFYNETMDQKQHTLAPPGPALRSNRHRDFTNHRTGPAVLHHP